MYESDYNRIQRRYYKGKKRQLPEYSNGQVVYAEEENELYIDSRIGRTRVNPPADWNEENESSPSYIANKPEVAENLNDLDKLATVNIIKNAISWHVIEEPDPWEEIINNENYAIDYQIGMLQDLDFGEYGVHPMELVAINKDDKADGSGKARMTWISKDIILMSVIDNSSEEYEMSMSYDGEWDNSYLKSLIENNVYNNIQLNVRNSIVEVYKYVYSSQTDSTKQLIEKIWIPSSREIIGIDEYESQGVMYGDIFDMGRVPQHKEKRIKAYNGINCNWWLRSQDNEEGYTPYSYLYIDNEGNNMSGYFNEEHGVVIGFCL